MMGRVDDQVDHWTAGAIMGAVIGMVMGDDNSDDDQWCGDNRSESSNGSEGSGQQEWSYQSR